MFFQPSAQGDILRGRVVRAVGGDAVTKELSADGVEARVKLRHSHFVLGPQPAVAVAEPHHLAGEFGFIGAARVPNASVDQYGRASGHAQWLSAGRVALAVLWAIDGVLQMRTGHDERVASAGLADVREVKADLQR